MQATNWQSFLDAARAQIERSVSQDVARARADLLDAVERTHPGESEAGVAIASRAHAAWTDDVWRDQTRTTSPLGVGGLVRCGQVRWPSRDAVEVPALVPLIGRRGLLIEGRGAELAAGHRALQSITFRLISSALPGKVRLSVIDPVGLGQTFADCLRFDERIRGPKFWHEEREIEDALVATTGHMAMVIQKYLKNQYASIDAYNQDAGEVAEPYRILLIANFPAGFEAKAAQRLLSIAANGPRVGVHVLMTRDLARSLPRDFDIEALRRTATTIQAAGRRFKAPGWLPDAALLELDDAPPAEVVDGLTGIVNAAAGDFDRVEVAFEDFLPARIWPDGATAAEGVEVPIGRTGARNRQSLRLFSSDTAPHVLIAGQTGSGKTVLLHVIITNLAMHYPPDELRLYLVDFKEGVEFLPYRALPHSHVVAVQSEREFGLSVLEGINDLIEQRGEMFKAHRVSNLADWRQATGQRMERVLLVVDEFQVLFAGRDAIGRRAGMLLDDIAKRGRSFGIHLILATQTLSQFELEPSTISQMAIRIALRMSEGDSYKVLGRENDAARYLDRPGEAIFNGHGGIAARNVKFQVAFVNGQAVQRHVDTLARHAEGMPLPRTVVFDGNQSASAAENAALVEALQGVPDAVPRGYDFFLGEPTRLVADGAHVASRIRRQGGGNLILVGADEAQAFRTMYVGLAGMMAQTPRASRLAVLNLTNVDDPLSDRVSDFARLSCQVDVHGHGSAEAVLTAFQEELERRRTEQRGAVASGAGLPEPWCLLVFGMQRGRAFRKSGFRPSAATEALRALFRDGADLGLHVLLTVDTYANLLRILEPADLADFAARVALPGGDALKVLGSVGSGAAALKANYLYVSDGQSAPQKARSYGQDAVQWINSMRGGQA